MAENLFMEWTWFYLEKTFLGKGAKVGRKTTWFNGVFSFSYVIIYIVFENRSSW